MFGFRKKSESIDLGLAEPETLVSQPHQPAPDPQPPVAPAAPLPRPAATVSMIASGAVITGSIHSAGDVVIEGTVMGDVRAKALTVGAGGGVTGDVSAETATIRGRVLGNVRARTIQLASTGSIEGDLTHAVLIIEEGGQFEGRSRRTADPLAEETPQLAAPAKSAAAGAPTAETVVKAEPAVSTDAKAPDIDDEPRSSLADALGDAFAVEKA